MTNRTDADRLWLTDWLLAEPISIVEHVVAVVCDPMARTLCSFSNSRRYRFIMAVPIPSSKPPCTPDSIC